MDFKLEGKKLFSDVATICTEKQFWKLADMRPELQESEYVSVSPVLPRGGTCARSWQNGLPEGHVAIVSDELLSYYISFLLNTAPCQTVLFEGKINVLTKARVNKKKIGALEIPVPTKEVQKIYAIAESLFEGVMDLEEDDEDDRLVYLYNVFETLCNCLAIDLFTYPMLREKGLTLFEDWAKVALEYEDKEDINNVMKALIDSDSPLRNDIMKFHILLEN